MKYSSHLRPQSAARPSSAVVNSFKSCLVALAMLGGLAASAPTSTTSTNFTDGRTNSPLSVVNTDPRTALLDSFNGLNPNGEWVLFVADLEAGDIHTLDNWGLEITGYTSPSVTANPANQTAECSTGNASFTVTA